VRVTEKHYLQVLVPVPVARPYTYTSDRLLDPGTIVAIPLGPRLVVGAVWPGIPDQVAAGKVREIEQIFDAPPLPESLIRFVEWVAEYTLSPLGMVLRMVLRSPEALHPERQMPGVRIAGAPPERMTDARRRVLDLAANGLAWSKSGLAAGAGVSPGVVDGLLAQGTLEVVALPVRPIASVVDPDHARPNLSKAQERAAAALVGAAQGGFSVALLDGVTGSGKTEVYFEAVAETLRQGRQALILLPEIALTGAFLDRFAGRFGSGPASGIRRSAQRRASGSGGPWPPAMSGSRRRALGAVPALPEARTYRSR
jgi:primosomal protein N' (replication factor Y)